MQRPEREYWGVPAQRSRLRKSLAQTAADQGARTLLSSPQRSHDQIIRQSANQRDLMAHKASASTDRRASGHIAIGERERELKRGMSGDPAEWGIDKKKTASFSKYKYISPSPPPYTPKSHFKMSMDGRWC